MTLKDRFNKKYPLASYEAVYDRLYRNNKEIYEKARENPVYPFSTILEVDKVYLGKSPTIGSLLNNDPNLYLGFDKSSNLFYCYRPKFVFLYPSLEAYIEEMLETLIS